MTVKAYKLWYEYLRRTDPNTWTDQVKQDFDGVLTKPFDEWFDQFRFNEIKFAMRNRPKSDYPVRRLLPGFDAEYLHSVLGDDDPNRDDTLLDDDELPKDTHIVLVINLSYPLDQLTKRVETQIKLAKVKMNKGRPAEKASARKYPFATRPDVSSLEIALFAYDKRQDGLTYLKIGEEIQRAFPVLQEAKPKKGDKPKDIADKKKTIESVVSRYLKNADALMENVVNGVFPKIK